MYDVTIRMTLPTGMSEAEVARSLVAPIKALAESRGVTEVEIEVGARQVA